jgi:hypothetical protein
VIKDNYSDAFVSSSINIYYKMLGPIAIKNVTRCMRSGGINVDLMKTENYIQRSNIRALPYSSLPLKVGVPGVQ